jgi:hypothetical protein
VLLRILPVVGLPYWSTSFGRTLVLTTGATASEAARALKAAGAAAVLVAVAARA